VAAIYQFARTADDLADEGEATLDQRSAELRAYRCDLQAVAEGRKPSSQWASDVFLPLAEVLQQFRLPLPLLHDLLNAFEQDLYKSAYIDREDLLGYCRLSANPVGRLLLHLYGVSDAAALKCSDAICSSLQLINFWQDFSRDGPQGRVYAPQTDLDRHGLNRDDLLACHDSPAARAMTRELCDWARQLMLEGEPLVHQIKGRAGWELRLVVQGGLRILEKIKAMHYTSLTHRPALTAMDVPTMLWRALRMRAPTNPEEVS